MSQESPVPVSTRTNEIVGQVMADHDLSQAWLCDQTGYDSGHISRVLQGQYSVPPAVLAALWMRTKDQRIARAALGEHQHLVLSLPDAAPEWREAAGAAIQSAGEAIAHLASHPDEAPAARGKVPRWTVVRSLDEAIARLCAARRSLEAGAIAEANAAA